MQCKATDTLCVLSLSPRFLASPLFAYTYINRCARCGHTRRLPSDPSNINTNGNGGLSQQGRKKRPLSPSSLAGMGMEENGDEGDVEAAMLAAALAASAAEQQVCIVAFKGNGMDWAGHNLHLTWHMTCRGQAAAGAAVVGKRLSWPARWPPPPTHGSAAHAPSRTWGTGSRWVRVICVLFECFRWWDVCEDWLRCS